MSEMYGFWFDLDGHRGPRMKPFELEEAKRLFAKHADIRTGNVRASDYPFSYRARQLTPKLEVRDSAGECGERMRGLPRRPP